MQHTLSSDILLNGIGLHTGHAVHMIIRPAPADHGIVFVRTDLHEGENIIPAQWHRVVDTRLCTVIANDHGASVGTIEHIMAALRGCGVDNARIDINAPEVPIMDGSAKLFVDAIEEAGLTVQSAPRRAIRVLKAITVTDGDKTVTLSPSVMSVFKGDVDYHHPDIGAQTYELQMFNGNFKHDVADCRTFGFLKDVNALRAIGLAQGGSLDNAIVLDDNGIMNPEGLRCTDEFVRHKVLDAVGDLYLAGGHILGTYHGIKAGHAMNNAVLKALFADPTAFDRIDLFVDIDPADARMYAPTSNNASVSVI
jgi:UDP-3-O-[3-hydroxymyristoyl] N-acetylglucosamine deacetylase